MSFSFESRPRLSLHDIKNGFKYSGIHLELVIIDQRRRQYITGLNLNICNT